MTIGSTILNVIIGVTLSTAISCYANGQDIEGMSLKNAVKVSGGVGFQTTSYTAFGVPANRDPFLWQLNLNLNLNLFGVISAPFSATVSSQQSQLSTPQPFNNFGISPKYKAFTAHLGYRSINLSEFSLNGSQFLGVGVEVSPKKSFVKGKVLYGRFAQPVYFNPDGSLSNSPSFDRRGWGAGITLGKKESNQVSFNVFKAHDIATSLDIPQELLPIKPAENVVFGIVTNQKISDKIEVKGEIDFSLYTNDVRAPDIVLDGYSYINNLFLFQSNSTTEFKKAALLSLNYKPKFAKFGLNYRRVDPGYQTLGTSFINNDYEDLSLKNSFTLLKKKIAISGSIGVQRNNLSREKVSQTLRLISSLNASYSINKKWNLAMNFANFSTNTRQTIIVDVDSLRFVQVTKSVGTNVTRTVSNDKRVFSTTFGANYQEASLQNVKNSAFYNVNLGSQLQFVKSKFSVGFSGVLMQTNTVTSENMNVGPTINMAKQLFNGKVQLTLVGAYLNSFVDKVSSGEIINLALNGSYTLFKKHNIGLSVSDIIRQTSDMPTASELTATLKYGYSF